MKKIFSLFILFLFFWSVRAANLVDIPDFFTLELGSDKAEVNQELSLTITAVRDWEVMDNYDGVYLVSIEENWNVLWNSDVKLANWWWWEFSKDGHWKTVYSNWIVFLRKWKFRIIVSDFLDDSTIWVFEVTVYADGSGIKEMAMFSQEVIDWYNWAYSHWITTQKINNANLWWLLTRQAMAKMIVTFSIDVLKKTPDYSLSCKFDDLQTWSSLNSYIKQACQLWLMWQSTSKFNPLWTVSRAQFWAILSRAIWWNEYEGWSPYYSRHLQKLKELWIMWKISNPESRQEMRWYVMLMMKRAWELFKNK